MNKLTMGWALDFMDNPIEGLNLNFWSGSGDLTLNDGSKDISYKGTNGVISIKPPREEANSAVRLTAEIDASDPAIRKQLRRDIGPLKVRVKWIYQKRSDDIVYGIEYSGVADTGANNIANGGFEVSNSGDYFAKPSGTISTGTFLNNGGYSDFGISTDVWYFKKFSYQGKTMNVVYGSRAWAGEASDDYLTALSEFNPSRAEITGTGDPSQIRIAIDPAQSDERVWAQTTKQFIGRLSAPEISAGIYRVDIESLVSDIDRGRTHYWSNDTQRARHSGDRCFEYMKDYATNGIDTKWPP